MRPPVFQLKELLKTFQRKKVVTKQELLRDVGCSTMTAWRLLRQHGYLTSYNDNARHYTLVDIPKFDEHGLWTYGKVRFSRWGSVTKTIVGLVQESSSGLTARRLQQLLGVKNVLPPLTRLVETKSLTREKIGGRFVYFPVQQVAGAKQRKERKKEAEEARARRQLPSLEHIIALLVEIIRRPKHTARQWAKRLTQQGVRMTLADIEAVLAHYNIDVKKGLLRS